MVHGAANACGVWSRWMAHLSSRGWPCYALDLRGHGRSSPPEEADLARVTMDDYVADVETVARQFARPPVIMGWSMGGLIAQMYAARNPETPAAVLLAPSPPAAVHRSDLNEAKLAAIPDLFGPEHYGIKMGHPTGGLVLRELGREWAARVMPEMSMESGTARRQRGRGVDIPADAIRCPVLVLYGEKDKQFPPALVEKLAAYYRADLLKAEGRTGHWGIAAGDAVDVLAPKVDAWLRERVR
jgi:pimeloyl-ACP methyl ester carboxylesterase